MLEVPAAAPAFPVLVQVVAVEALGAPADPTKTPVQIALSPTRVLAASPTWISATWVTDRTADPTRYFASVIVGAAGIGVLAPGVYYPFVLILGSNDQPVLAGKPFRIV